MIIILVLNCNLATDDSHASLQLYVHICILDVNRTNLINLRESGLLEKKKIC